MKDRVTAGYYWNAVDRTYDSKKNVIMQPETSSLCDVLETYASCLNHRDNRLSDPRLSSCLSAGDAALADVKPFDDLCAYAVLDLAPCGLSRG